MSDLTLLVIGCAIFFTSASAFYMYARSIFSGATKDPFIEKADKNRQYGHLVFHSVFDNPKKTKEQKPAYAKANLPYQQSASNLTQKSEGF